jgi:carboxyl-terminal processing protease
LIIGSRTFSVGEDFAMEFDFMKRGLLVGEPTGGSTGQPVSFVLPGGERARICAKRDTYPDGKKFAGIDILPDVQASAKISDFIDNKDSVLERALKEIKRQSTNEANHKASAHERSCDNPAAFDGGVARFDF